MASYDDASRCPKCGVTGKLSHDDPYGPGERLHTLTCENSRCSWFETIWTVLLLADGTVPDPQDFSKKKKTYTGFNYSEEEAKNIEAYARWVANQSLGGGR